MQEINDLRPIELEVLSQFDSFCRKHNLNYYLAYGSLLGAIRHGGIIPWDDDIDVAMPRNDFEFFIKTYKSSRYFVATYANTENYFYPFAKMFDKQTYLDEQMLVPCNLGVGIDVFPIDGVSPNKHVRKSRARKIKFYRRIIGAKLFWNNDMNRYKKALVRLFASMFSGQFVAKRINDIAQRTALSEAEYWGNLVWGYGLKRDVNRKESYINLINHSFEDGKFFVPRDYDSILTRTYGDYMKPPSDSQKKSKHHFKAYYRDKV